MTRTTLVATGVLALFSVTAGVAEAQGTHYVLTCKADDPFGTPETWSRMEGCRTVDQKFVDYSQERAGSVNLSDVYQVGYRLVQVLQPSSGGTQAMLYFERPR